MSDIQVTTRNADLGDMAALLKDHRARGLDVIVNPAAFRADHGQIVVDQTAQVITEDGVTQASGRFTPTKAADSLIGTKLGIHGSYLTRLRESGRWDIYDANVNGWLHGGAEGEFGPDSRNFMLRLLRPDSGLDGGVLRAMLSDTYKRIDNLDVLLSALDGIRKADPDGGIEVDGCDLTDSKMYVRISAPGVQTMAPAMLAGYRNPFSGAPMDDLKRWEGVARREGMGYDGGGAPVMFAGFVISNSEIGQGAFSITPRITVRICRNGLTISADALTEIHRGTRQTEGVIEWSADTQRKELELVALRARDAVTKFLDPRYLEAKVRQMEQAAGVPVGDPVAVVREVVKQAQFPNDLESDILGMFTRGGQATAGGVMQAITAVAQTVEDAELAALMEAEALPALNRAAVLAAR